eukprot:3156021-Amphidinium_carterae.1
MSRMSNLKGGVVLDKEKSPGGSAQTFHGLMKYINKHKPLMILGFWGVRIITMQGLKRDLMLIAATLMSVLILVLIALVCKILGPRLVGQMRLRYGVKPQ